MRELVERAIQAGPGRVVVPGAEAESALDAAVEARRRGLAEPLLLGAAAAIRAGLAAAGEAPDAWAIEDVRDPAQAARRAVERVRAGEAEIILKGGLSTGELMRAVLDRERGLRAGRLVSDVLVTQAGVGEPRLLGVTDGGVNVAPTLAEKRAILENAVEVFHRLGVARPRVAALCALETVSPAMPHTAEAAELAALSARGELPGCEVFGPVALDGALSVEAARHKGLTHPAAGQADLLLVPAIEVGNALGKAFTWLAARPVAHVVWGALAPVLIPSRAEGAMDKLCSMALGVLVARGGR
ncbi:phosphate acyltransferase [Anaeromyxobacter diazotrophicus]|uniref:Phosphate butyryltransferase n=1 Tax=Anaeromyxobacter diazotrophicus TaxID=2590199 RepID=A0A7I9VN24_9BACT|nr:phosphate acyltransferase [Anaeromyxobacter diazotrophicus]GEJ57805.1 phosphate butyryltransferase [Anaeromyxobacter diazotrophicus]